MPVTFDTANSNRGTGASITVSLTLNASANGIFAFVAVDAASNFGPAATWNGVSMGALVAEAFVGRYGCYFFLASPDTGTHDLVVSSLPGGGEQHVIGLSVIGYVSNDAAQVDSSASGTTSQLTNTSDANDLVVSFLAHNTTTAPAVDSTNDDPAMTIPANGSIANANMSSAVAYQTGQTSVVSAWTTNASKTHFAINVNGAGGGGDTNAILLGGDLLNGGLLFGRLIQ